MNIGLKWKYILEWDVVNWRKAITFWERENINYTGKKVLEIGSRKWRFKFIFFNSWSNCCLFGFK